VLVVGTDVRSAVPTGNRPRRHDRIVRGEGADRLDVVSLPETSSSATAETTDRLSGILSQGGPQALITAVHDHLGVDIAHYVEVDYTGFQKLIDAAGGISLKASTPLRDAGTGLALDGSCQHLDGAQALQLARSRRVEYRNADASTLATSRPSTSVGSNASRRWSPDPAAAVDGTDPLVRCHAHRRVRRQHHDRRRVRPQHAARPRHLEPIDSAAHRWSCPARSRSSVHEVNGCRPTS
jgi:LCP family protein required for cell wall assembly